jgi:hypothetical protein
VFIRVCQAVYLCVCYVVWSFVCVCVPGSTTKT